MQLRLAIHFAPTRRQVVGAAGARFGDDPAAKSRRAEGHDIDLQPIGPTDDGALNPAGGLRSTAKDLLRFLDLFLDGNGPGSLPEAARRMLAIDRPGDRADTRMALGWRRTQDEGETFYWSDGSGDGSRAFMGFNPGRHIAVVALGNAATGLGVDDIGAAVIVQGQTVNLKIPKARHQITLSPKALDRFAGVYRYAPGDEFIVTHGAFGLLDGSGPSQFPIYPETATRFFAKVGDVELEFASGKADVGSSLPRWKSFHIQPGRLTSRRTSDDKRHGARKGYLARSNLSARHPFPPSTGSHRAAAPPGSSTL